jgi:hypothetical protein
VAHTQAHDRRESYSIQCAVPYSSCVCVYALEIVVSCTHLHHRSVCYRVCRRCACCSQRSSLIMLNAHTTTYGRLIYTRCYTSALSSVMYDKQRLTVSCLSVAVGTTVAAADGAADSIVLAVALSSAAGAGRGSSYRVAHARVHDGMQVDARATPVMPTSTIRSSSEHRQLFHARSAVHLMHQNKFANRCRRLTQPGTAAPAFQA